MAVLAFIKQHIATTDASSFTFSSTSTGGANDIGALASDRQIIIGGSIAATTSATRNISSIAAGGVSLTLATDIQGFRNIGTFRVGRTTIGHALLATATTVSIVLTATTTVANCGITVWSATECSATAATHGSLAFASATVATMGVTVNTDGFFSAQCSVLNLSAGNFVWTGATEVHDTTVETGGHRHAAADGSSSAAVTITATETCFYGAVWIAFDNTLAADGLFFRKNVHRLGTRVGQRMAV